MAKQLNRTTKIAAARNTAVKTKAASEAKAKVMNAIVGADQQMADNKVVDIKGTAVVTNDDRLPVIALSAAVDPTTIKDAVAKQRYAPTEDQKAFVAKLIEGDITATFAKLRQNSAELAWNVACISVALCCRLMKDRNEALPLVDKFMDALAPIDGQGAIRINGIKAWLEGHAPVTWGVDNLKKKRFLFDGKKHQATARTFANKNEEYITARLAVPFWKFKPEADFASFNFDDAFASLMKKAEGYSKLTGAEKVAKFGPDYEKTLNMGIFAQLNKVLADAEAAKKQDKAAA